MHGLPGAFVQELNFYVERLKRIHSSLFDKYEFNYFGYEYLLFIQAGVYGNLITYSGCIAFKSSGEISAAS